jgi:hypothetical protein
MIFLVIEYFRVFLFNTLCVCLLIAIAIHAPEVTCNYFQNAFLYRKAIGQRGREIFTASVISSKPDNANADKLVHQLRKPVAAEQELALQLAASAG